MSATNTLQAQAELTVVYAQQEFPHEVVSSIFLAGPTPRKQADGTMVPSWRPEAIKMLRELGFTGTIFVPEDGDGEWRDNYDGQIEWEEEGLNRADCIVYWVPRELNTMPALTTNDEWGTWKNSGKVVFGAPPHAVKVKYQQYYAKKLGVPSFDSLEETLRAALKRVGEGAYRRDGECQVPLYIWQTPSFEQWYTNLREAGNRLDGARVEWTHRLGEHRKKIFFWILHVNVFVAKENRNKTNEVVISRPNISTVVAYYRPPGGSLYDTEVVLVKEFRSPVLNSSGYVLELPGGSTFRPNESMRETAAHEFADETGFSIKSMRLLFRDTRQLAATLSAHNANLFSVELTQEEMASVRSLAGVVHGVAEDTERTYVEVWRLADILASSNIDWSMVGMILSVLR